MDNNDQIVGEGKQGEEDLLDFEFDDLSPEDLDAESSDLSSDDDIIDLIDIIEPGEMADTSKTDELSQLLNDDDIFADEAKTDDFSDMSLDELAQSVEMELSETLRKDLDTTLDGLETSGKESVIEAQEDASEQFELEEEVTETGAKDEFEPKAEPELSLDEFAETMEADFAESLEEDKEQVDLEDVLKVEEEEPAEAEEKLDLEQIEPEEKDLDTTAAEAESESGTAFDIFPEELVESVESDVEETPQKVAESSFEGKIESEEARDYDLEFLESDLGSLSDIEIADESTVQAESGVQSEGEGIEVSPEIPPEDFSEVGTEDEFDEAPEPERIGLSEEKIEAIITKTVHDVVERVAKEAMTEVAERLITEAIDALKESLESSKD